MQVNARTCLSQRAGGIHAAGVGDRRNLPAGEFDVERPPRDFRRRGLSALECDASTMIQLKTMLNCIDNSGAAVVECVNVLKKQRPATVGDRIVVVVQKQRNFGPESSTSTGIANKVRRGDIRHAVVVRAAKEMQRPDGSVVKFDDNACVLVNKTGDPIGTRMNGVVATELRGKQWSKILSLAPLHV